MKQISDILKDIQDKIENMPSADYAERREYSCYSENDEHAPCPYCGGDGWVSMEMSIHSPMFGKLRRCPKYNLRNDIKAYVTAVEKAGLKGLDTISFEAYDSQNQDREFFKEYGIKYSNSLNKWLVITGSGGVGKTYLAICIAKKVIESNKEPLYISLYDLFNEFKDGFSNNNLTTPNRYAVKLQHMDMLFIDNFYFTHVSAWEIAQITGVLQYRLDKQKPTVLIMRDMRNIPSEIVEMFGRSDRCLKLHLDCKQFFS